MNLVLFDGVERDHLLPFTFTRPVAQIRIGILTISEKWEKLFETKASYRTQPYLQEKFSLKIQNENLFVNGSVCPDYSLMSKIIGLKKGEGLYIGDTLLACKISGEQAVEFPEISLVKIQYEKEVIQISNRWSIYKLNGQQLEFDFKLLTDGRISASLSKTNTLIGDKIFIEPDAKVEGAIINATDGPVYIGKGAEVMEGCTIRGAFSLGDNSTLKMGAKIYGATTIGPHCKVGGEVNNSVIFGYSNKGHDGFLGNAVLGEWVNIGADSNNSNLKNNYDQVRIWSYVRGGFERTGQQFCGLMMGDHSKCGINTMFNTGTVVGVSANIFGAGFPRNFVPSFSWGGPQGYQVYLVNKAIDTANRVMERRGLEMTPADEAIFNEIFKITDQYRNF